MITGLTSQQALEQSQQGNGNVQTLSDTKTVGQIVWKNLFTYFNLIYLILTILVIWAGSLKSLTFLPAVLINTLIGTIQEIGAKRTMDKLTILNRAKVITLRDGERVALSPEQLVLGDVILLRSGAQIPADARIIEGHLRVNEALLTGEADEIEKDADSALLSGSFVVSGEAYAVLTQVGDNAYASRLIQEAKKLSGKEQSEMVRDINRIILIAGIAILPIGAALFTQSYFLSGASFRDSIESMVAAVVGMIPQGLTLLCSAALALSAIKLARRKVLLHDMRSVETLARADVLCVDKTGTITENRMTVKDFIVIFEPDDTPVYVSSLLGAYLAAMPDTNATMQALRERFKEKSELVFETITPFSSKRKFSSATAGRKEYRLGAPDILLEGSLFEKYEPLLHEYEQQGLRVLAFVCRSRESVQVLGFITLENPIREDAMETFAYFKEQGVRILVISGDNPVTVSHLAERVGIDGAEHYVNMTQVEDNETLCGAVKEKTVFGRASPEQKKFIVEELKRQGHTVAMTGDGVNDILAMKGADCSIAMGSGSDAAMQAAQVVLLDSSFSRMKKIVSEGRRDINNIERSATLFLVKNIFSLLLGIFSVFMLSAYPLKPSQISLISSFNIGIPATLLALEKNEKRQEGRFIKKVLFRAMPAATTDFVVIASMAKFGEVFGISTEDISVAATYLLVIVGFMILIQISRPLNLYRGCVMTGCALGLAATGIAFSELFSLSRLSYKCALLLIIFAITTEPILRYLTKLSSWIEKKHK